MVRATLCCAYPYGVVVLDMAGLFCQIIVEEGHRYRTLSSVIDRGINTSRRLPLLDSDDENLKIEMKWEGCVALQLIQHRIGKQASTLSRLTLR